MTGAQIDAYLKRATKGRSPLIGLGNVFVRAGKRYGVSPRLLVAIAGAESSFGQIAKNHNAFGWGPHIPFSSWEEGINTVAKGLASGYIQQGLKTIPQIGSKWAPVGAANDPTNLNSNWVRNVQKFMRELGGGPLGTGGGSRSLMDTAGATPAMPDLGGGLDVGASAMQALSGIAQTGRYDPLAQLSELATAASVDVPEPSVPAPTGPAPRGRGVKPGGGWGGSKGVAYGLARQLGLTFTSEKRDTQQTSSGNTSDHWVGNKNAYAIDLGGPVARMDRAAVAVARRLGLSYKKGSPLEATVTRKYGNRTYRIQVLYRTHTGGNHFDHLHVGVKLLG